MIPLIIGFIILAALSLGYVKLLENDWKNNKHRDNDFLNWD